MASGSSGGEVETSVGATVAGFSVECTMAVGKGTVALSGVHAVIGMSSRMKNKKKDLVIIPIS